MDKLAFVYPGALAPRRRPAPRRPRTTPLCSAPAASGAPSSAQLALVSALRVELPGMFCGADAGPDLDLYAPDVAFRDPLNRFRGAKRYADNIAFLGRSFVFGDTDLALHDAWGVEVDGKEAVRTRWTLGMTVALPWRPRILFTGTSDYVLGGDGVVAEHIDRWDSLSDEGNKAFPSAEAVRDLVALVAPGARERVEGPVRCEVLRRGQGYVVRRYAAGALEGQVTAERLGSAGHAADGRAGGVPGGDTGVVVVVATDGSGVDSIKRKVEQDGAVEFGEGCVWEVRFSGTRNASEVWIEADQFCVRRGTPGESLE